MFEVLRIYGGDAEPMCMVCGCVKSRRPAPVESDLRCRFCDAQFSETELAADNGLAETCLPGPGRWDVRNPSAFTRNIAQGLLGPATEAELG